MVAPPAAVAEVASLLVEALGTELSGIVVPGVTVTGLEVPGAGNREDVSPGKVTS